MRPISRLALANIGVAVAAFGIAAAMAMMQALSRANLDLPFRSEKMYYLSVTAHGVLMAIVFTTFFIMGLGYVVAERALKREVPWQGLAWTSYWVAVAGTAAAAVAILSGRASVLYTFYPPLKAHPAFYIGATLLVVGSWGWCAVLIRAYRSWRTANPDALIPVAMHGMLTTVIVWCLATVGVASEMLFQLIPWSLGVTEKVDPILARTLFWWFGHPLVYFWLLPAYVLWYTVAPKLAGGKLFSEPLAKLVFVMFIVLSTPVGFHHQAMDPGISANWKLFHTFNTLWILYPSFITAFTVIASLEVAGRMNGGTGTFGWIAKLPFQDPMVASVVCAGVLFMIGGFGGAINASYSMNAMVHNTSWVPGHFHTTVGSAAALTFMGAGYWLVPKLSGKELELKPMARVQPWLWFLGMLLFSIPTHITGLRGMPRRIYLGDYNGDPTAATWKFLTDLSAVGGIVLFASALFFVLVMLFTVMSGRQAAPAEVEFAEPLHPPGERASRLFVRLGLWTVIAVVLLLIAYAFPIMNILRLERFGSPGYTPF
jgi:cytochrome c oxidase subunit 1